LTSMSKQRLERTPSGLRALYKASETGIVPTEELNSARKVMSEEEYEQEYELSFSAAARGCLLRKGDGPC
jgi:phage terminase large subunit